MSQSGGWPKNSCAKAASGFERWPKLRRRLCFRPMPVVAASMPMMRDGRRSRGDPQGNGWKRDGLRLFIRMIAKRWWLRGDMRWHIGRDGGMSFDFSMWMARMHGSMRRRSRFTEKTRLLKDLSARVRISPHRNMTSGLWKRVGALWSASPKQHRTACMSSTSRSIAMCMSIGILPAIWVMKTRRFVSWVSIS